jgi:hypothetical protein
MPPETLKPITAMYDYQTPKSLLTYDNAKTVKGETKGWLTAILYMAPALSFMQASGQKHKSLCPKASEGCKAACLFTAGRGKFDQTKTARLRRADMFLNHKEHFLALLTAELHMAKAKALVNGQKLAVRLNGTSDIVWERLALDNGKTVFDTFPETQFYDYTKIPERFGKTPANYHLTYSVDETGKSKETALKLLKKGYNVAAVFASLPETWNGFPVLNGDENDLTFTRPPATVQGLTAKGEAKKDTSGFVIR